MEENKKKRIKKRKNTREDIITFYNEIEVILHHLMKTRAGCHKNK